MVKDLIKQVVYPIFKSRPDFLIVGAQKAGTTGLYRYLEQHHQLLQNKSWKEVHYFDDVKNYEKGLIWYLGHFPYKVEKKNRLVFEATPEYLFYNHIPQLIKQDLGEMKIMIILRHPADRAYSAWKMYNSFQNNPHEHLRAIYDDRTFAEAISQEMNNKSDIDNEPYHYLGRGKYIYQIENYLKYFAKDSILVLDFNDFKKNIKSMLDNVCDFLEIERFSQEKIDAFETQKYNVGNKQEKTTSDKATLESLKEYFIPYNKKLYELLDYRFEWL
ncbi:MAG: sulfotransferase domain-containing protein [Symploca sp. SIO2G7]|nr:sulfotransferase domain-containing protein [Symploca sp. SIO2G7]